jgi:hypothetical protein
MSDARTKLKIARSEDLVLVIVEETASNPSVGLGLTVRQAILMANELLEAAFEVSGLSEAEFIELSQDEGLVLAAKQDGRSLPS